MNKAWNVSIYGEWTSNDVECKILSWWTMLVLMQSEVAEVKNLSFQADVDYS